MKSNGQALTCCVYNLEIGALSTRAAKTRYDIIILIQTNHLHSHMSVKLSRRDSTFHSSVVRKIGFCAGKLRENELNESSIKSILTFMSQLAARGTTKC